MTADSRSSNTTQDGRTARSQEWVYETIIRSIPGLATSRRVAIAVQFLGFELGVLLFAWVLGLPDAAVAGTAGVVVAVAGSIFMLGLSRMIREAGPHPGYRRILFGSRIELLLGLMSFFLLIVYVFIYDPRQAGPTLVESLLGDRPAILFSLLLLMIGWDVTYRIGVGWWASVAGLWRTVRYRADIAPQLRERYSRIDGMTIAFAAVQLLLVPILAGHPLLQAALLGHVLAVAVVSGTSILLLR